MSEDFFSHYLSYTSNTETPTFFHRWSCITGIGTFLGRDVGFPFAHFNIHPNMYVMLMGSPGTRKSTAIKTLNYILKEAGYDKFAADRTSKEKFLLDLSGEIIDDSPDGNGNSGGKKGLAVTDFLDGELFGDGDEELLTREPREVFISADEFNDFIGIGNIEFISLLGTMWDYNGIYKNRIKNGKSISIVNPTVSILAGNTPTSFNLAFPPDVIGQGFFSRLLLIYGEPNGKKIAFPEPPDPNDTAEIVKHLRAMKELVRGEAELTPTAKLLMNDIYTRQGGPEDVRFQSYSNRRFTHLIKLCIICAASRLQKTITEQDVLLANSVLSFTEHLMPRALGEFGKSRDSDIADKIMRLLLSAKKIVTMKEITAQIGGDIESPAHLSKILQNLAIRGRMRTVNAGGVTGYTPVGTAPVENASLEGLYDFSLLTEEERNIGKED